MLEIPTPQSPVSLREVSTETVREICGLKVTEAQNAFVAPNAISIAQAYFEPKAWLRAIYAGETPVGFLMVYNDPEEAKYFLWRYMIDERYQRMGFGRQAMLLLIEHVRTSPNASEFRLSCVPAEGGAEPFYARLGFERTGKMFGDEVEMRLALLP
jgi:diamine N-acetyltransferase